MPEPTICPVCGGELEGPWVRFHYARPFTDETSPGHYVDGSVRNLLGTVNQLQDHAGQAPPPPDRPKLPKGFKAPLEEDVRWDGISLLRILGYTVYNLEQGHRPDGGHTRVGKGIPDVYFQGHGCTGWIEFKRPDGKPAREKQTKEQKAFEREELRNGGTYLLVEATAQLKTWHEERKENQLEVEL